MKFLDVQGAIGLAIILLSLPCDAKTHNWLHIDRFGKRHTHHKKLSPSPRAGGIEDQLQRRGTCQFPTNAGLVAITPGSQNGGWALSPNQACEPDSYCPYACPPGQVMAQWSPSATSYTYPESLAGGLYCDKNGQISKPFPEKPYCVDGTGTIGAQNTAGKTVAFCQTVLPGNEAMLIPTSVDSWSQIAVPGPDYWCGTASHFYINPPGYGVNEACVWSDGSKPIGNWSPYVAGANTDSSGNTYVKIAWNPEFTGSWLKGTKPTFGVKIECSGSGCSNTPCSINPTTDGVGGVTSASQSSGAGDANFCVVTVPKGESANIVVFSTEESNSGSGSQAADNNAKASAAPSTSAAPTPTPTPTTLSSAAPSKTSHSHSQSAAASSTYESSSTKSFTGTYSTAASSTTHGAAGNFFQINETSTLSIPTTTSVGSPSVKSTSTAAPAPTVMQASVASETISSGSIFSLIVMFAVAGFLL